MSAQRPLIVIGALSLLIASCREPRMASVTAPTGASGLLTPYTLSGVISEATPNGLVPLAGAAIHVSDCPGIRSCQNFDTVTDENGHYGFQGVHESVNDRYAINVTKYGYKSIMRPLNFQTTLDIQLDPTEKYSLSGVVTELTPAGLVPVEGALVTGSFDNPVHTDGDGFFSIPGGIDESDNYDYAFLVIKDGYQTYKTVLTIDEDTRLDIQLVRK